MVGGAGQSLIRVLDSDRFSALPRPTLNIQDRFAFTFKRSPCLKQVSFVAPNGSSQPQRSYRLFASALIPPDKRSKCQTVSQACWLKSSLLMKSALSRLTRGESITQDNSSGEENKPLHYEEYCL
jgi:hypothetical protein